MYTIAKCIKQISEGEISCHSAVPEVGELTEPTPGEVP